MMLCFQCSTLPFSLSRRVYIEKNSKKLFFAATAYLSVDCENSSQSIPDRCLVRMVEVRLETHARIF